MKSEAESRNLGLVAAGTAIAALVATIASYLPGMAAGFYYDDTSNIVNASAVHLTSWSLDGLLHAVTEAKLPTRALANLTFALNHLHGGLEPGGYHWVNLIIHLLVGASLTWVVVLLVRTCPKVEQKEWTLISALAATGLFLLHPLNIQAVTYVVQRMTSLATLFSLLSFGCYISARNSQHLNHRRLLYIASAVSWIFGMASKEIAALLLLVLVIYEACFHGPAWKARIGGIWRRPGGKWLLLCTPPALAALGIFVARFFYQRLPFHLHVTTGVQQALPGYHRLLSQSRAHFFYLSLLLWPAPSRLNLLHDFEPSTSPFQPPSTTVALVALAAMAAAAVWLARRHPHFGFPVLAYAAFHLLESGPLNLVLVFEHRMYLPMAALTILVGLVLARFGERHRSLSLSIVALIGALLALATYQRNQTWADHTAFLQDCATKSPKQFQANLLYGRHLGRQRRFKEAEGFLTRATQIPTRYRFMAFLELGTTFATQNRLDEAIKMYSRAAELKPDYAATHNNLGKVLLLQRRYVEAARRFVKALRLDPSHREAGRHLLYVRKKLAEQR